MSKSSNTGKQTKRFGSKRAYRRWLKRQGGRNSSDVVVPDTRQGLEALEQRVLLSASPVFELSDLLGSNGGNGSEGVVINGVSLGDRAGISVSSAGDVNGDGFDDVIIGAFRDAPNGVDSGASFVVFGKAGGFNATLQLSSLNGTNGFKINGISSGDISGRSVAGAGDVNNDGYDDLLIGAFLSSANGADSGQAYVVYGQASGFSSSLDLSSLNGTNGFTIDGVAAGDQLGFSVRGAGDINGDGIDDFILGATEAGSSGVGAAYVVFGQDGGFGSSLDLTTLSGSNGFKINGVSATDQMGISVSGAGDVNGDGVGDLVVGAFQDDPNGGDSGAAFVVFGATSGFSSVLNPGTLNGSNGFVINGVSAGDTAGRAVSGAGDFNGDGYADILIGAPFADGSATDSGNAYVVFGKGGGFSSSINLSSLNGSNGFKLNGVDTGDQTGFSVSGAGDVNGDGLDDLLVSADRANPNGIRSGETYLVFGRSTAMPAALNLSAVSGADGFVLNGIDAQDRSGVEVRSAGDVDGDGFGDFIIGAFLADPNGAESGETYLVFGDDFSDAVTHLGSAFGDSLVGSGGADVIVAGGGEDILTGNGGADVLIAGEGDDEIIINGTGFSRIDGGSGTDKLMLNGTGISLDLTAISDSRLTNIETIDITGGTNTITLDMQEVLNISGSSNLLTVIRDINGTVNMGSGWTQTGSEFIGDDQYITFTQGNATLVQVLRADVIDPVVTVDQLTTDVRSPQITGTVSDLDPSLTMEVTVNGIAYVPTIHGDGTWSISAGTISPDLADGIYQVIATAEDTAGNIGTDQSFDDLIIDNADPVVTVDSLTSNSDSPELTGTIVDLDPATTINVNVDGNDYAATNNGDGTWTLAAGTIDPVLTDNVYEVVVTATDTVGHTDVDDTSDELTIDLTAPVVTIDGPGTVASTSPELTGTVDDADTSATVQVAVDNDIYDAVNNGDGTWTLLAGTIDPALAEGTYQIDVQVVDAAGNAGLLDAPVILTVDTAPVVTVDVKTTSDPTPRLSGTIVDTDTTAVITVTVNGNEYTAINHGDGTWRLPNNTITPALADGVYDVLVSATDSGSNVGTDSTTDELTIDTTAPTVTIDTLYTNDSTPELTGTYTGLDVTISVTVDGISHTATNNGDGTWTLADNTIALALADGVYDVVVTGTNLANIQGTDATTDELTVDQVAPVVTIDAPGTKDTGSPELTGAVDDADTNAIVQVSIAGGDFINAINNGDGTWTLPAGTIDPALADGTYTVDVRATDAAGNEGHIDPTIDLEIDLAPVVTVTAKTTSDQRPELTGTISDSDPTTTIVVTVNGIQYNAVNNGDGTWTLPDDTILVGDALPDGTYDISVVATDSSSNVGSDTTTDELTINTSTPIVTVNSISTRDRSPELTGTVSDPSATIQVSVEGNTYDAINNGDGTWTLPDDTINSPMFQGLFEVVVMATTLAEVPTTGFDQTTNEIRIDTVRPLITIDSMTTADSTPELTGTVTDTDPATTVTVTVDGNTYTATRVGNTGWVLPDNTITPALAVGTYDLIVTGLDTAGNVRVETLIDGLVITEAPFSITVDALTTNDLTPELTGTIDDLTATVQVTVNGSTYTAVNNGDGTWILPDNTITTPLTEGVYDVQAAGTNSDPLTLFDATTDELNIDITAPVVTINSLTTSDTTPQITGTIDDPTAVVTVIVNANAYAAVNNGDGTWTLADNAISPALPVGTYNVQIMATDGAGNVGADGTLDELLITIPSISTINLEDLLAGNGGDGTGGVVFNGVAAYDLAGNSASTAGDINGDGYDDLIIGAPDTDPFGENVGTAYVIFGQAGGFPAEFDLSTLNGTNGFLINGLSSYGDFGVSVASAGDFNGDGLDDLIIGADKNSPNGYQSGVSYVIFGTTAAFSATFDVSTLNGTNGFSFEGEDESDRSGFSVSSAGDVNGDGLDDVMIGSLNGDDGVTLDAGRTYVILGTTSVMPAVMNAGSLTGANGFIITGPDADGSAGFSVSTAGDMNGDGIDDLRIGAPATTVGVDDNVGKTFVVFGQGGGFSAELDLSSLNGTNGFVIVGDTADMELGFSGSSIGDFNGDGYDDLLVSAPASADAASAGSAYVIYGQAGAYPATFTLSMLNGTTGFTIQGVDTEDRTGFNVAGVGDVNGDGYDDLLIGASKADGGSYINGESYLVFGRATGIGATLDLASVPGNGGIVINGAAQQDQAGRYVSAAGDVNGDGYADLIVAARNADLSGTDYDAGQVYLIFGRDFSGTTTQAGGTSGDVLTGTSGRDAIIAGAGDDELVGNGGPDVLSAGQGDDTLAVSDTDFVRLDGGNGFDTLRVDGAGVSLDLTAISDAAVSGIEQIDIRGTGANSLTLDLLEVLNLSDTSNTLLVLSDSGDTVDLGTGWTTAGQEVIDSKTFDVYTQGNATVKVYTESTGIVGDLDGDGFVGITDLNLVLSNWNATVAPGHAADPSGDGFIGIEDLNYVLGNWNAGTPPTAASSSSSTVEETAESTETVEVTEPVQASEPEASATLGKVSLVDEVAPATATTSEETSANSRGQSSVGWGWMLDGNRGSRSAFVGDGEDEGADDSALGLAEPMAELTGVSRL